MSPTFEHSPEVSRPVSDESTSAVVESTDAHSPTDSITIPLEVVPVNVVLASIARDSRQRPANFLEQVQVRHGGE